MREKRGGTEKEEEEELEYYSHPLAHTAEAQKNAHTVHTQTHVWTEVQVHTHTHVHAHAQIYTHRRTHTSHRPLYLLSVFLFRSLSLPLSFSLSPPWTHLHTLCFDVFLVHISCCFLPLLLSLLLLVSCSVIVLGVCCPLLTPRKVVKQKCLKKDLKGRDLKMKGNGA